MFQQSLRYSERTFLYVAKYAEDKAKVTIVKNGNFAFSGLMFQQDVHDYLSILLKIIGQKNCQIIGDGINNALIFDILT